MPNVFYRSAQMQTKAFSGTTSPVQIVAGVAGKSIQIHAITLVNTTAQSITLEDSAASPVTMSGAMAVAANGVISYPMNPSGEPWFTCTAAKDFQAATGGTQIAGTVMFVQA